MENLMKQIIVAIAASPYRALTAPQIAEVLDASRATIAQAVTSMAREGRIEHYSYSGNDKLYRVADRTN